MSLAGFVAGAALSQGQVQISRQAQHFCKVKCRCRVQAQHFCKVKYRFRGRRSTFASQVQICGRRSTFARSSTDCVAGAALSQSQVYISRQAQHFCKVKHRCRGTRSTFARPSTDFVAAGKDFVAGTSAFAKSGAVFVTGAALSQGQVQISWQAQHFRKVKYRYRGRRCSFASLGADFVRGRFRGRGVLHELKKRRWLRQATRRGCQICRMPSPSGGAVFHPSCVLLQAAMRSTVMPFDTLMQLCLGLDAEGG